MPKFCVTKKVDAYACYTTVIEADTGKFLPSSVNTPEIAAVPKDKPRRFEKKRERWPRRSASASKRCARCRYSSASS